MDDAAVEVLDLVKTYRAGAPPAVDGVSLSIAPGEIYGLLGSNGSGKSTTLSVLATLLLPSSGAARVLGIDVVDRPKEVRARIGVTLQEAGVDPAATGRALLLLHGRLLGLSRRASATRAAELLELVDLASAADRALKTYSGGMRRRLDLALALVGEPAVLFLDEPTTGLDPISRQALWAEVRTLREQGTTILLTTQYLEEADQLADRVGILDHGRLLVEGTPDQLKRALGGDRLVLDVDAKDAADAAAALGGEVTRSGQVAVTVPAGGAALPALVAELDRRSLAVRSLSLSRPSLDDVFLAVVGSRLTGADSAAA